MLTARTVTPAGTRSFTGAKLRIPFIPDLTIMSAVACALPAGTVTTAISGRSLATSPASVATSRT